ncbi:hypothetical protein [Caulobacter segnis]|nr:hypothetical protein [Caulobacter segnis]
MKSLMSCLALLGVAAILTACVALPSKDDIAQAVTAPGVDAAAANFETAVAVLASSIAIAVDDPDAGVDEAKLAKAVRKAADALDEARVVFDARSGDPGGLIDKAFGALGEAVPMTASPRIRFALSVARGAGQVYAGRLHLVGAPAAPSERLKASREDADRAIAGLLARLPPPET